MKRLAVVWLAVGMAVGYSASQTLAVPAIAQTAAKAACAWGPEMDAVAAAPKNHKILLENDRVRVLDVTVQPGEREVVHAHCNPSVLYIMQRGALRDYDGSGKITRDEKSAPDALPVTQWHPTEPPHSVENLDSKPLRILRVEVKS